MLNIRATFDGSKELKRALKHLGVTSTRKALTAAAKAGAEPILQAVKEKAPVDTGKLKTSMGSRVAYRGKRAVRVTIHTNMKPNTAKGSRLTYDVYQEFGTVDHPAQPFMRPAFDEQKGNAVETTRKAMSKAVLKEVNSLGKRLD